MKSLLTLPMLVLFLGEMGFARSQDAQFIPNVNFTFECDVTGTKMDGSFSTKTFKEKFFYEKKLVKDKNTPKGKPWSISKTELYSDGKKYEESHATAGDGYLVFNNVTRSGSGFNQKLMIFTHYIDISSAELERVVTLIPKDTEERTKARCKKIS